jgi:hypothetical protein
VCFCRSIPLSKYSSINSPPPNIHPHTRAHTHTHTITPRCCSSADGWDLTKLTSVTVQGDANECYYAIFDGKQCESNGAVYLIEPDWYVPY